MSPRNAQASGPVIFAYDGSKLADLAIEEAGGLLADKGDALVVCVWEPFDLGFVPPEDARIDASRAPEVKHAAQRTAEVGVQRAKAAGFRARALAVEAAPTWKGLVSTADEHDARLIVLGSHGRTGLAGMLTGSVASAVAAHSNRTVLITHRTA
jgi:nucleotide-binding universal stress UspA family protein